MSAACPRPRRQARLRFQFTVVHRLPGRVRVRLDPADAPRGELIVAALGLHPEVTAVRWTAAARSITVHFHPEAEFEEIASRLHPAVPHQVPSDGARSRPLWREFLAPAAALAAGLAGAGVASGVIIGVCALPVLRRAASSLLRRELNVDILDTIAIALLLGTGNVLAGGVSVMLIETGERIRHRAAGRARRAMRGWMGVSARGVRVRSNGSEPRLPIEAVSVGDHVVVYPGESIPVDGVVIGGSGALDMRSWTGESIPHDLVAGGAVLAGTSLSNGRIVVEVTAIGDQTRAGRLAFAIEEALAAETQVADLARRIADRFVLPVLVASGLAFAATRQLSRAIAMLIFDYGTGIRIAIPTTVLTTMVAGARQGILFKSGRAVEELAWADTIVFDKTGTLTSGQISVLGVVAADGMQPDTVLRLAAAAEGHVPHPIARAIRRAARRRRLELPEPEWLSYRAGGGVEAIVEGHRLQVGDRRLLEASGVTLPSARAADSMVIHVSIDGQYVARIRLKDTVRASAHGAIERLRRNGVRQIWLATGDNTAAAAAVTRHLGLDGYSARLMPEDKVALVRRLREEGRRVAVVGDGINDAPAMAEANVSVAVPRGADLARETADIVLLTENLEDMARAVRLARSAMGLIRENIGLVAVPNTVGMLLATAGRLNPLSATLISNGSTIVAGVNALRPLAGMPHEPR